MTEFRDRLQTALAAEFMIERELGGAGMSRVFVATERALNRTVVVKVLPPELAAGVNVERFRREIQLAAQLQHPHIVPLLAAGDDQGLLWFSMPYIEGESLRGALARYGRLPPRDVVRIVHDVVDALSYAHARGVVHRDIKPDNILTSGMHALVTDFGVAKALSAAIPVHGGTTTGMAIGTPAYMAPEQLAADPAMDHRVDLYAVGLLAYELLTGMSPFSGSSPQATLAAQLTLMPAPPHGSFSDIPEPLSLLIMHCLEKDAARRPQSAEALLAELEALPPMSGSVASRLSRDRRGRRRQVVLAAGALGVLATIGWAVLRPRSPEASRLGGPQATEARDAGPGGDVQRRLQPVAGAATDSVTVYPDVTDAAAGIVVPFVITRAESLAIAEAIMRRQSSSPAPTPSGAGTGSRLAPGDAARGAGTVAGAVTEAMTVPRAVPEDSLRIFVRRGDGTTTEVNRALLLAEVGRIFADSMAHAIQQMEASLVNAPRFVRVEPPADERDVPRPGGTTEPRGTAFDARRAPRPNMPVTPLMAPPTDARPRVVVVPFTNATGKRELGGLARDAAVQLREAIAVDKFDVVSADVTDRTTRALPDKMSVGWALRADYVVSGWMIARGDSVAMVTMLTDVRTGRFSRAVETVAPAGAMSADVAKKQVSVWLDTAVALAARRRAAESTKRELQN